MLEGLLGVQIIVITAVLCIAISFVVAAFAFVDYIEECNKSAISKIIIALFLITVGTIILLNLP